MGNLLGTIGGAIGIIVFLGTLVVYLRGSRDKGTIATLEASNKALTERVGVLVEGEADLNRQIRDLRNRMAAVERENAELRAQRPSAEAIAAVYSLNQAIHSDTQKIVKAVVS